MRGEAAPFGQQLWCFLAMLEKFSFYFWTKMESSVVSFSDCLFLPDHSHNLISLCKLRQNGPHVNFGQSLSIFVNGKASISFEEHANLYVLKGRFNRRFVSTASKMNSCSNKVENTIYITSSVYLSFTQTKFWA